MTSPVLSVLAALLVACATVVVPAAAGASPAAGARAAAPESAPDSAAVAASPADSIEAARWSVDLVGKLSASQVGYQNWTEGGANTMASTTGLDGTFVRESESWSQKHELRLVFGVIKQDTLTVRKAEDVIRLRSSLQYKGEGFFRVLNPTLAMDVNTQFVAGYNWKKNPFKDERKPPVKVSDLFSPAAFTQSLGLTYDPVRWFKQRVGVGAKQTVVLLERMRRLYNLEPDQAVRMEIGIESRTTVDRELVENVRYRTSLGLFAAFNQSELPDMRWENLLAMKVNEWLGVNFEVTALLDKDISERMQFKEALSVGVSFAFI